MGQARRRIRALPSHEALARVSLEVVVQLNSELVDSICKLRPLFFDSPGDSINSTRQTIDPDRLRADFSYECIQATILPRSKTIDPTLQPRSETIDPTLQPRSETIDPIAKVSECPKEGGSQQPDGGPCLSLHNE
jgi:hypothetical protein